MLFFLRSYRLIFKCGSQNRIYVQPLQKFFFEVTDHRIDAFLVNYIRSKRRTDFLNNGCGRLPPIWRSKFHHQADCLRFSQVGRKGVGSATRRCLFFGTGKLAPHGVIAFRLPAPVR